MSHKLLWGEGQFLRPQHFQQQDAYHERQLQRNLRLVHPYAWGVERMVVDHDALASGMLRLHDLALRFPDGELIDAPAVDPLPEPLDLNQASWDSDSLTVHAALPCLKPYGGNVASGAAAHAERYRMLERDTADQFTQAAAAQLAYLCRGIQLLADGQARDGLEHLPLLRVRRLAAGGYELDREFVAPSLTLDGAPALLNQLRRLLDALQAKVNALYGHQREPNRNVLELRSADTASFWLLHTASSGYASLAHHAQHPRLHPERLYQSLLQLAGALMTFSKQWTLADLPPYQHAEPGPAFASVNAIIRDLLDTVISTRYLAIPLASSKPSYYQGQLVSDRINERTAFLLAVHADMPLHELVEAVPIRFKVGAPDDVEKLVLSALPGVRLQHAPQLPSAVPVRPETCYFTVDSKGPIFERMLQAKSVCVYAPSGMNGLRLELVALLD